MAIYNTESDAANTAVRAFLTTVGEYYLQRSFNTGSGPGRRDWLRIRDEIFLSECAYCGIKSQDLQVEHLIMFNRTEYGLHHPGNTVPVCKTCNKRLKKADNSYMSWDEHLNEICARQGVMVDQLEFRRTRITRHMTEGEFKYPALSAEEKHSIRVIANSLYEHVKMELNKSLKLYQELQQAFCQVGSDAS